MSSNGFYEVQAISGPGTSLGNSITSPAPPGDVQFELLNDEFTTANSGMTTGPVRTNDIVEEDFNPPRVTAPTSIQVRNMLGGVKSRNVPGLAAFLAGGLAVDDIDPRPLRIVSLVGATAVNDVTVFLAGPTTVTFRFMDRSGNVGTANSSVTVLPLGDLNVDGRVDCNDLAIVRSSFGRRLGQGGFDPRADLNGDGIVNVIDLTVVSRALPAGTGIPLSVES